MLKKQKMYNKIIITLIMVLTINFIAPNYSQAKGEVKAALADGFQTLVCLFCDGIINIEQKIFTGNSAILDLKATEKCNIKYGVATIVSGTLDFFKINFFTESKPTIVQVEDDNISALRNMYPKVKTELENKLNDLEEYDYESVSNALSSVLTVQRYHDTGNIDEDESLYESSFYSLISYVSPHWEEVYGEKFEQSKFYKCIIGSMNIQIQSFDDYQTNMEEYFNEDRKTLNVSKFIQEFEKIKPVIEKYYMTNQELTTTSTTLAPSVRSWYVTLRNFALVLLLSILVYMGIKIVISSTSNDKAKYKQKIINVLVAICILFIMQYIMSITMYIIDVINDSIGANIISEDGTDILMSQVRTRAEISKTGGTILAYTLIYLVMVYYTIIFTVMYIKRILTIVLLTIFAPLVTITYPLDKEKDGQSQAFNFWLKEYVFNLLIQPVHLLLYYIFISMAMGLGENGNVFWAMVVLFFMRRAEKIMRKMFKLDNSGTLSDFGAFAGGMALTGAIKRLANKAVPKAKKGSKDDSANSDKNNNIKTRDIEEAFKDDDNIKTTDEEDKEDKDDNNEEELDETGKQWQNYIDNQEGTTNAKSNQANNTSEQVKKKGQEELQNSKKENSNKITKKVSNKKEHPVIRGISRIRRRTLTGKNIAKLARGVGKVGLGAAGLTIGAAAGIATGDLNNVFKYGAGGIAAGMGTVDVATGGITAAINAGKAIKQGVIANSDEFKIGYNDYTQKEYEQNVLIPRIKKQNAKNKEIRDKYERELGSTEFLKSSARDELYNAGITNEDMIIKALKIQREQDVSDRQLAQNAIIASKIKEYKDLELREKQLKEILEKSGLDSKKIDEELKNRMKVIAKLSGMN